MELQATKERYIDDQELKKRADRPAHSQMERKIAARIVLTGDKVRGVKAPQRIVDLAKALRARSPG